MNKILFSLILMLMSIAAQAEIWYYIPAGQSPKGGGGLENPVYIVIKDNNGQLWGTLETKTQFKEFVAENLNWYIEEFNSPQKDEWSDDDHKCSQHFKDFWKISIKERTAKYFILFARNWGRGKCALSLDFKTLIMNADKEVPCYYQSVPIERFVVRRNVDDLF